MTIEHISLPKVKWKCTLIICYAPLIEGEILNELSKVNSNTTFAKNVLKSLSNRKENFGATFSNFVTKQTLLILGEHTSEHQMFNTFAHELTHLCCHIANAYKVNKDSESFAYLSGYIFELFYELIKNYALWTNR